jgi:hypothetical protein
MSDSNRHGWTYCWIAIIALVLPLFAQGDRGKAEMKVGSGKITVDYGRPQLNGRDPLTWQEVGAHWRMGKEDVTSIGLPVGITFGGTKIAKGNYGLWLLKVAPDKYELVFNTDSTGMVMTHDKTKDVARVSLKKEALPSSVELFTIELKEAPGGGRFALKWGTVALTADFQFAK